MADKVSKFILPVKTGNTIADKEFDVGGSGGSVSGPSSAVDNRVATFDGTTGKLIKDSGYIAGKQLTNENLDDVTTPGVYYANSGNSVSNKPSVSVDGFGLTVSKVGSHLSQTVISTSNADNNEIYRRYKRSGVSWSTWIQYFDERYYTEAEENQIIDGLQAGTDKTQQMLAPIQTTLVALKDYAVGEQFVYNGLLYEVTSAIASGGTITIDANCKLADNVTNQILLLTSELNKLKNATRRTQRNITTDLANLPTAVAEQNLEKYGYSIGDYFIGNSGYTYFLADMNTFRGAQSNFAVINQNHISIVVKTGANSKWNDTNDTSTGYSGSVLHSYLSGTVLDNIKSDMIALFGGSTGLEHLLSHQLLWTTATSSWNWSGTAQYISALTEPQVYGTNVWAIDGYQTGEAWKHLELFKKFRYMEILGWILFWLRSIRSASGACHASYAGDAGNYGASGSGGVVGLIVFK